MRHAKSSWKSDATSDHERPLNGRGRRAAPRVAARLAELGWLPDHVLSSDARRTVETAERMIDIWPTTPNSEFTDELYHADLAELIAALIRLPASCRTVLALGHNPGWEFAATELAGEPITLKTADAALFETTVTRWSGVTKECWRFRELIRARSLD